jgi:transposase InsO family protein
MKIEKELKRTRKFNSELLLKKCQIEKKSPTIKEVVEEIRSFMQRNTEAAETSKALATSRKAPGYVYNGPKCSPGFHKPEECSQLKLKPSKEEKPVKALHVTLQQNNSVFILDSGATTSMFNSPSLFPSYQGIHDHVYLANGDKAKAIGHGTASIKLPHVILQLKNSLLVPTLTSNLISLSVFIKNNYTLKSGGGSEFILADKQGAPVITGSLADGNFIIHQVHHSAHKVDIKSQSIFEKHQAAGHPSPTYFFKMFPHLPKIDFTCNTCDISKAHKEPFLGNFPTPTRPLEYLHVDLCGPISNPSVSGHRYFLRAVDGFSHFVWIRFLAFKSDVNKTLRELFLKIENESNNSIVNLVSDNGTEFKNKDLTAFYTSKGMNHLTTAPYTPEENPLAERGNRTTVAKLRCLLNDSNLPSCFWAEAAQTAVYLENITPCKSIDFSTPFFKWFGKTPSVAHLHPFGCEAIYFLNRSEGKLGNRGARGIFLGYWEGHRSYRILDAETGNVKITHHVKFNHHAFPSYPSEEPNPDVSSLTFHFDDDDPVPESSSTETANPPSSDSDSSDNDQRFEELLAESQPPQRQQAPSGPLSTPQSSINETPASSKHYSWVPADQPAPNNISSDIDPSNIVSGSRRSGHSANAVGYMKEDPQSYNEAIVSIHREDWILAIESELGNMENHDVWTVVTQTKDMHPLTTTWVFRRKTDQDGNLTKFKARLYVRGFLQKEGRDYTDVFSPTGRLTSLRILLTLCALNNFEVHQMDVKCAFLNGKPDEDLYIKIPQGLNGEPGTVLKLNKSLYGLKQSPWCWHQALTTALKEIGLTPCHSDPCLYFSSDESRPMFLYAHVDNLIFGGTWTSEFKSKISTYFEMEDLGIAKYALGIRIIQDKGSIKLIQDKYIDSILTEFQVYNNRDTSIPLPNNYTNLKFTPSDIPDQPPFNYRRVVGLLQYVVQCTRPDLAFAVSFLSQFLEDPRVSHYQAARHALRYLCHTKSKVLILGQNDLNQKPHELVGYSDSDWNGSKAWNSYSGSVIYYNGTIGWRSHKQDVVALSSAEGEYIALTECNQDLLWAANVLEEITRVKPTLTLYTDNQSSMQIAKKPIYHHGTRHMNFRYHFIRDHIQSKIHSFNQITNRPTHQKPHRNQDN